MLIAILLELQKDTKNSLEIKSTIFRCFFCIAGGWFVACPRRIVLFVNWLTKNAPTYTEWFETEKPWHNFRFFKLNQKHCFLNNLLREQILRLWNFFCCKYNVWFNHADQNWYSKTWNILRDQMHLHISSISVLSVVKTYNYFGYQSRQFFSAKPLTIEVVWCDCVMAGPETVYGAVMKQWIVETFENDMIRAAGPINFIDEGDWQGQSRVHGAKDIWFTYIETKHCDKLCLLCVRCPKCFGFAGCLFAERSHSFLAGDMVHGDDFSFVPRFIHALFLSKDVFAKCWSKRKSVVLWAFC